MDLVNLVISLLGIIWGVVIIHRLRKRKKGALGFGGGLILLGLVALATVYGLVSGPILWVITGPIVVVFVASFVYLARKMTWAPK